MEAVDLLQPAVFTVEEVTNFLHTSVPVEKGKPVPAAEVPSMCQSCLEI